MNDNKRMANYDILRALACISIILLHISSVYYGKSINDYKMTNRTWYWSYIINGLTRYAVPVFVMLSGAFQISNSKNKNYQYYYKKIFLKVFLPTFFFGVMYSCYSFIMGQKINCVLANFLKGNSYYHMWYLYMIFGLYFLTPFIIRILEDVNISLIGAFLLCFIITISGIYTSHFFSWDIGYSMSYMGYYIIGYIIFKNRKRRKGSMRFICIGFLIELMTSCLSVYLYINGLINMLDIKVLDPLSPITYIASVFIFAGFSGLKIDKNNVLSRISKYSLYIYLWHAMANDLLFALVRKKIIYDSLVFIIIFGVFFVLSISMLLAVVTDFLYKKIIKAKGRIL
ncbi:acyltransferase [Agathobacter sp.]